MKSILFSILMPFFFLGIGNVSASEMVTLAWDAVEPAPSGYRIYMSADAGSDYPVQHAWEGTSTTCQLPVPDGVEVAFVARAFVVGRISGNAAESGNSNEVTYLAPPKPPGNLIIQSIDRIIEALNDIKRALSAG